MDVPENADIDFFERWNVTSLKDYLARHGISRTGKKRELAALAGEMGENSILQISTSDEKGKTCELSCKTVWNVC